MLSVFRDVHDFVLEYKQIGPRFSRQADHIAVVIFDPAMDHFSIRQLDTDGLLLLSQPLQISCLLRSFVRRRGFPFARGIRRSLALKWHS
jgi:hypothetical protein